MVFMRINGNGGDMSQSELMKQHQEIADEFLQLLDNTNMEKPHKEDVKALRVFLRQHPELWAFVGDLAEQAILRLIDTMVVRTALKESLKIGYKEMQIELGMATSPALERLLIQQVVMAWLRLAYIENQYTAVTGPEQLIRRVDHWERRLNAAQRRFLRATSTLARIRKMNLPPIQVNIGQNQINQLKP
jgi:hypothetical protein